MSLEPQTLGTQRLAVIDIGSNSVRFVVYQVFGAAFFPTYNEKVLAGLGRDLRETGRLSPDGKRDTVEALRRFRHLVDARRLKTVLVGATAAMREASDALDFRHTVRRETGFDIAPVSGVEEARLAAAGVLAEDARSRGIACDLGGASLELVKLTEDGAQGGVSLKLGPFQVVGDDLRADFAPDRQRELLEAGLGTVDMDMEGKGADALHLVGGAWRNLFHIHMRESGYPLPVLQGYRVAASEAARFCAWARGEGREKVSNWPGISERRRETLPYSALVLEALLARFKAREVVVSASGLREGLVAEHLKVLRARRSALVDGCRDLARGNLRAEGFARPMAAFLAPAEAHLPHGFAPADEARLRGAAHHLAGMGRGLHPDSRVELVFTNVISAPLSGLTHAERAYLACILHGSLTSATRTANDAAVERLLSEPQRRAARAYGAAMRLAVAACGRAPDLLPHLSLFWDGKVRIKAHPGFEELIGPRVDGRLDKLNALLG